MNDPKSSSPFYTILPIFLGVLCILATVSLTFYYRSDLKNFAGKTAPAVPDAALTIEINKIENEINSKKIMLGTLESFVKMDEVIPKPAEEASRINDERIKKIEKLNAELSALELKKEEFKRLEQESIGQAKGSFDEEYGIDFLTFVICFGALSLCLAYATFIDALPRKNGAAVNFERKAFLFFLTALSGSAFGLVSYLWYLSI